MSRYKAAFEQLRELRQPRPAILLLPSRVRTDADRAQRGCCVPINTEACAEEVKTETV